eukprot:4601629-Prymnesium_polylepis.1
MSTASAGDRRPSKHADSKSRALQPPTPSTHRYDSAPATEPPTPTRQSHAYAADKRRKARNDHIQA